MTSPDLINELKASRPATPQALRARVREISAQSPAPTRRALWPKLGPVFRIAVPAVVTLAVVSAGCWAWRARRNRRHLQQDRHIRRHSHHTSRPARNGRPDTRARRRATSRAARARPARRRSRRTPLVRSVSATLTVEVATSDGVSRAAQDALALRDVSAVTSSARASRPVTRERCVDLASPGREGAGRDRPARRSAGSSRSRWPSTTCRRRSTRSSVGSGRFGRRSRS